MVKLDLMNNVQEAIKLGEELAKKYNSEGISPFPFEKILDECKDLKIHFVDLKENQDVSGAILYDKDKDTFDILINKNKPEVRRYFTIAHELGHYFLHKELIKEAEVVVDKESSLDSVGAIMFRIDAPVSDEMERAANHFAASLIMPERLVRKAWDATNDPEECAKIFGVSLTAMTIRLSRLGLIDD